MTIWEYDGTSRDPGSIWSDHCPFCRTPLRVVFTFTTDMTGGHGSLCWRSDYFKSQSKLERCFSCGWWKAVEFGTSEGIPHGFVQNQITNGAAGSLKELDLEDLTVPIQEIRDFLVAKYERRFEIHPQIFEETVASVFSSLGWHSSVTAYSNDRGIDAILEKAGRYVGVQVKRYKNSIAVEQIRSLAGALVLNDMTEGIFVTTSSFQRGAGKLTRDYELRGYRIHLIDSSRFFDALKIAQSQVDRDFRSDEFHRFFAHLEPIETTTVNLSFL